MITHLMSDFAILSVRFITDLKYSQKTPKTIIKTILISIEHDRLFGISIPKLSAKDKQYAIIKNTAPPINKEKADRDIIPIMRNTNRDVNSHIFLISK